MDSISKEQESLLLQKSLQIKSYNSVLNLGKAYRYPSVETQPEDIFTLSFTSGTTGVPKAAMLTNMAVCSSLNGLYHSPLKVTQTDSHLSYLPLSHIFER